MSVFIIAVPRTRRLCGRAVALSGDGRTMLGPVRVLATASARVARAHGNPLCAPALPFGHPPLGTYVIAASLPPGHHRRRAGRYGHLGALVLEPVSGDAAAAGRRVVLHGGPLDPRGRLRPTRGGLRVSNRDLAALLGVLNEANAAGDPLSSVEIVEAAEPPAPAPLDRPGGRRVAGRPRRRAEMARRDFLTASALLLAGMAAGSVGCGLDAPSCCRPVTTDWGDGGLATRDAQPPSRGSDAGGTSTRGSDAGTTTTRGSDAGGTTTPGTDSGGTATDGTDTGGTTTGGIDTGGDDNGGYTGGGGFG